MAATSVIWKSLGQVMSGVECFYQLASFDGDMPPHEETQLRGAAYSLLEHMINTGQQFRMDMVFEAQSPFGKRVDLIFQPYPQDACASGAVWPDTMPLSHIRQIPTAVN